MLIDSKKGTLRANHYHKTDWHYCYVISGSIEYYHRPTGSDQEPECVVARAGDLGHIHDLVITDDDTDKNHNVLIEAVRR